MTSQSNPPTSAETPEIEVFYARAIPRMLQTMLIVGVLSLFPALWFCGWVGLIGVAAGCGVSYVNFRVLARGVESLTDRVVNRASREKGRVIVFRFLVRYGLVAVVAYAIFRGSTLAFRGFLWGLCLPVAAMMIEASIEGWVAFRKQL